MVFDFTTVPRIVFGKGQLARAGELAVPLGKSALLVHNADAVAGRVAGLLGTSGMGCVAFRQRGEPVVADVDAATVVARREGCDLVIGLGGGSALDAAKAVAGLITNDGSAIDYMEIVGNGRKISRAGAPFIAIPTTAGTGAEATRNAVIGCPEKHFKASIRSEHILARIALVDPELMAGLPPEVTARCGMDALCQLIESYTSINAQPMTDALAIKGIELAGRSLLRAYQDGGDIDARSDMAMAALLSGITLANAGLGAVHGFAAPLGANYPIAHGTVCAALLPHVMAANVWALRSQSSQHPALLRYATIGRLLTGQAGRLDGVAIDGGIAFVAELARDLAIQSLGNFGLAQSAIPGMVALARKSSSMKYNPVTLTDQELAAVLRAGIG